MSSSTTTTTSTTSTTTTTVAAVATALAAAAAVAAFLTHSRKRSAAAAAKTAGGRERFTGDFAKSAAAATTTTTLRCGSRKSQLAMVQSRWVCSRLVRACPEVDVEILEGVSAMGDNVLNVPLKDLAAKTPGLFTKELEDGLVAGSYDFVVHSLKDMPTTLPDGLVLAAITEREDPRDALVVNAKWKGRGGLAALPEGAIVGTSSVRREAVIRRRFPHLVVKMIRGNVITRLSKVDRGEFDAVILARAGLVRLGLEARIEVVLGPEDDFLYGVGQGALGVQCRASDADLIAKLSRLSDADAWARCTAERALLRSLQGGCQVPLGVHTRVGRLPDTGARFIEIRCQVSSPDGSVVVEGSHRGAYDNPADVGEALARKVLDGGAKHLIQGWSEASTRSGAKLARPITYGSAEEPSRR